MFVFARWPPPVRPAPLDGLWRTNSDPSSTGSGTRLSKGSNGKGGFDEQYQLAGAGGIEPPNGGIKTRLIIQ